MQCLEIMKSEQDKVSWLRALLRRERKKDGKSRVVIFVNTEESALALHKALRTSFAVALNAGSIAADGLAAFREGRRLVLITRDGNQPATELCSAAGSRGAVAVSWEAPLSLGAHRARMKTAAGMVACYQLLVLRHSFRFAPPLDPAYANALRLSMTLAGKPVPAALKKVADAHNFKQPVSAGEKRRRESTPIESLVFFHGATYPCCLSVLHTYHARRLLTRPMTWQARPRLKPSRSSRRASNYLPEAVWVPGCTCECQSQSNRCRILDATAPPLAFGPPSLAFARCSVHVTTRRVDSHATANGIKETPGHG